MKTGSNIVEAALLVAEPAAQASQEACIALVRYYDEFDVVTRAVQKLGRARERRQSLEGALPASRGLRRAWVSFRLRRVESKIATRDRRAKALAVAQLRVIAETSGKMAVGNPGRSFHTVQKKEEVRDVLEAAGRTKSILLCVFGPGNLLAGRPSYVGMAVLPV